MFRGLQWKKSFSIFKKNSTKDESYIIGPEKKNVAVYLWCTIITNNRRTQMKKITNNGKSKIIKKSECKLIVQQNNKPQPK